MNEMADPSHKEMALLNSVAQLAGNYSAICSNSTFDVHTPGGPWAGLFSMIELTCSLLSNIFRQNLLLKTTQQLNKY
jgi:hypothetical protein